MVRTLFMGVALILAADVAGAQITTYMAPPRPPAETPQAIAAADSARKDSVATATMTNMRAWVDSAAGVPAPQHVGTIDSAALASDPGRPDATTTVSDGSVATTTFSDGSVAPATASDLPMLALIGFAFFVVGALLLAYRHRG
jgi:hypothetical protein